MSILLSNNASSLLAAPILAGDTALLVSDADAGRFPPVMSAGDYCYLTLEDRRLVPNLLEVVKCTARSGSALTIVRAQEGTTAHAFFIGAVVSLRVTAQTLLDLRAEEAAARAAADTAEIAARIAGIAAETTRATAAETAEAAARATAIANEQTTRANADAAETAARIAADTAEVIARTAAITAAVAAEATIRTTGDTALQTQITGAVASINAEIANRAAAVAAEATTRATGDAALQTQINNAAKLKSGVAVSGAWIPFSPAFSAISAMVCTGVNAEVHLVGNPTTAGCWTSGATDGATGLPANVYWIAIGT